MRGEVAGHDSEGVRTGCGLLHGPKRCSLVREPDFTQAKVPRYAPSSVIKDFTLSNLGEEER